MKIGIIIGAGVIIGVLIIKWFINWVNGRMNNIKH